MMECRALHAGYAQTEVLHGIDLRIAQDELVGLLGPNGSGKTTLLLALSGVLPARGGDVLLDGTPLAAMAPRERARRIATVPQRPEVIPDVDAFSLVLMGRYPHTGPLRGYTAVDHDAAAAALAATGTAHLARRSAATLSGGELQRVLVARVLAQDTDTLLLDEVTAGLDVARMVEVFDLLAQRHRHGLRIVAAIHDINLAALYCTRLVFLKSGRVVLDGPVAQVFDEQALSAIYETRITVHPHPVTGTPQASIVPGVGAAGVPHGAAHRAM